MKNEFVPYELALKLKQLGFNEPCFGLYAPPSKTVFLHHYGLLTAKEQVLAPLFQQAFRWFREKYGVYASLRKYDENQWWVEWGSWTSSVFETFEEAELACLDKLIEIVETKQQEQ
jgi:hypothetical protein